MNNLAVAIRKNRKQRWSCTMGNFRVCWYFLQIVGEITYIISGDKRRSNVERKGLVVPCIHVFREKQKHLDRLITVFVKLKA